MGCTSSSSVVASQDFQFACREGDLKTCIYLHSVGEPLGRRSFFLAALNGNWSVVEWFLKQNYDPLNFEVAVDCLRYPNRAQKVISLIEDRVDPKLLQKKYRNATILRHCIDQSQWKLYAWIRDRYQLDEDIKGLLIYGQSSRIGKIFKSSNDAQKRNIMNMVRKHKDGYMKFKNIYQAMIQYERQIAMDGIFPLDISRCIIDYE